MSDETKETIKSEELKPTEQPEEISVPVPASSEASAFGPTPMQWGMLAAVSISTAALDLWSKAWAVRRLSNANPHPPPLCTPPPGQTHYFYQRIPSVDVPVIRDWLEFRYAENCGGAWGLLHGASESIRKPFFLAVTVAAVIFILRLYKSLEPNQTLMRWALPLVLGGALGNLADRLRLGYVVDFIDMHYKTHHWPTYNVADIAITIGIGLMMLEYIFGPSPTSTPTKRTVSGAESAPVAQA